MDRLITDARAFRSGYVPQELYHREGQIAQLSSALGIRWGHVNCMSDSSKSAVLHALTKHAGRAAYLCPVESPTVDEHFHAIGRLFEPDWCTTPIRSDSVEFKICRIGTFG